MQDIIKIRSKHHPNVVLKAIPGHFVKTHSHVNYYFNMTTLNSRLSEAQAVANELSKQIEVDSIVDTIVCMDGCEVIGAFLAEALSKAGICSMNTHKTIYITTPQRMNTGQFLFRDNFLPMIKGKHILLLFSSATTGQTIKQAVQTLSYYEASISGISAIFSAADHVMGIPIKSLFTIADVPDYKAYDPDGCELCRRNIPVDAFASGLGYERIN